MKIPMKPPELKNIELGELVKVMLNKDVRPIDNEGAICIGISLGI